MNQFSDDLKDFIKGDELRIKNILETFGVLNDSLENRLSQAIGILETHCVQYGVQKIKESSLTSVNEEKYFQLLKDYDALDEKYHRLKDKHIKEMKVDKEPTQAQIEKRRKIIEKEKADKRETSFEVDFEKEYVVRKDHTKRSNSQIVRHMYAVYLDEEKIFEGIMNEVEDFMKKKGVSPTSVKKLSSTYEQFSANGYIVVYLGRKIKKSHLCHQCGRVLPTDEFYYGAQWKHICRQCHRENVNRRKIERENEGKENEKL